MSPHNRRDPATDGASDRGPTHGSAPRFARGLVAILVLAIAVPATGLLVAFPLWFVATEARGLYTSLAALTVAGLLIRHVVQKARRTG